MRFTYYTEKTIAQSMMALNERMHGGGRVGLQGWVEKNGSFSLAVSSPVARWFTRTTRLQAKAERQGSVTVVKGYVSDGVAPGGRIVIFAALGLVAVMLIVAGALLPALIAVAAGAFLNIPLTGDYNNSQVLIAEVQRALKAKDTPPIVVKKVIVTKKATTAKPKKPAAAVKKPTPSPAKSSANR